MDAGFLGSTQLWLKALHISAVLFWMAGLFMLPRYLAYHSEAVVGSAEDRLWQERERRLLRIIIVPAMAVSWILGLLLAANLGAAAGGWLIVKLVLVLALSAFTGLCGRWRKDFIAQKNRHSSRFYRFMNEIPTVATLVIVLLAVVRPF